MTLQSLRRLYHHLVNGGIPTDNDVNRFGGRITLKAVSAKIAEMEKTQTPYKE